MSTEKSLILKCWKYKKQRCSQKLIERRASLLSRELNTASQSVHERKLQPCGCAKKPNLLQMDVWVCG